MSDFQLRERASPMFPTARVAYPMRNLFAKRHRIHRHCAILIITQHAHAAFYTHWLATCTLGRSLWLSDASLMLILSSDIRRQCVLRMRFYTSLKNAQASRWNWVWFMLNCTRISRIWACVWMLRWQNGSIIIFPCCCFAFVFHF